jgi:hypothetical protein
VGIGEFELYDGDWGAAFEGLDSNDVACPARDEEVCAQKTFPVLIVEAVVGKLFGPPAATVVVATNTTFPDTEGMAWSCRAIGVKVVPRL